MTEIESLLKSGADVNTKDKNHFTLLMTYVKKNNFEIVNVLLRYGANVNLKDLFHFTALDYAILSNNIPMVTLLVRNGAEITDDSYMLAVEKDLKEIVAFFDTFDPNKQIFLKYKTK